VQDKPALIKHRSINANRDVLAVLNELMLLRESQLDVVAFARLAKLIRMQSEFQACKNGLSMRGELMSDSTSPQVTCTNVVMTDRTDFGRYKTELCRPFEETGSCKYGSKCQFAHGVGELRQLNRHPKYKTELCRTFHTTGFCPYGPRCHFVHHENDLVSKPTTLSSKVRVTAETYCQPQPYSDCRIALPTSAATTGKDTSSCVASLVQLLSLLKVRMADHESALVGRAW